MTRTLATTLMLLSAATAGAQADHLQCFKIRDSVPKTTYTATLAPSDNAFPVATGCVVKVPAKLLCVDVVKTITAGTPPGAGPGAAAQKYLCYKVKCPKATPTATIQDQFGTHQVTAKGTSLLCAPEPAPTSTTTTTASTTTTTTGGCTMNNQCPPAANATGACQAGMCTIVCNAGFANCDLINANGCEVDLSNNPNNCGGCGAACPNRPNSTPACNGSMCGIVCNPGFADCDAMPNDGCEVSINNNPNDCGGCAVVCPSRPNSTPTCNGTMCGITCNAGFLDCDANSANGCEVDTANDPNNCGGCGHVCGAVANGTPFCSGGSCQVTCNAGFANCDLTYSNGCEINTTNSNSNCGGCGIMCPPATPTCSGSTCH